MFAKSSAALAAMVVLSACSTSEEILYTGTSADTSTTTTSGAISMPSFSPVGSGSMTSSEYLGVISGLLPIADAQSDGTISVAEPAKVLASYSGFVSVITDNDTAIAGRLDLDANFLSGTVTGEGGDFASYGSSSLGRPRLEDLSGRIPVTNGSITSGILTGDMDGSVTGALGTYTVDTGLLGVFLDNAGTSVITGLVTGSVVNPDASVDLVNSGLFAASE